MMCVPGTVRSAAPPNSQSRPPSPRPHDRRIDHSLHQPSERGTISHIAGRIDNDVVPDHHPSEVCRLAHVTDRHVQVWRNGSVNETQELRLVSHEHSDFVSPLKRQSENALAGVASCAKEKDFHDRTSSLTTQATGRAR